MWEFPAPGLLSAYQQGYDPGLRHCHVDRDVCSDSYEAGRRWTALAGLYGVGFMFMELGVLYKLTLAVGGPTHMLCVLLFAVLLSCGLGSLLSSRFASRFRSRLGSFAIAVAFVGVLTTEMVERCYRLEGVSSSVLRVACVLLMLVPIGLCLGAPFPERLRRHSRSDERRLAYLWAANGVGSVLGGGLTLILLPTLGGHIVLLAGSVHYCSPERLIVRRRSRQNRQRAIRATQGQPFLKAVC